MREAPFAKDWKRHVRMLPTAGLFAFRQHDKNTPEIATVHIKKIGTPRTAEGDLHFSIHETEKTAGTMGTEKTAGTMGTEKTAGIAWADGERRNPRFLPSLLGVPAGKRSANDLAVKFGGNFRRRFCLRFCRRIYYRGYRRRSR